MSDVNTKKTIMSLVATTSDKIRNLLIKDGQLIFIQDLGRIAFDFKGSRVFYNQIVELETDAERMALDSPLNGYYFVIGTGVLWSYQDEWIQITGAPQQILFVGTELPTLGQENKIYVDVDDKEISVWDEATQQYIVVANHKEEITDEQIESLFD